MWNASFIHSSFIYKHTPVDRYTLEKEIAHSMSQIPYYIKGNLQLCALFLAHDVNIDLYFQCNLAAWNNADLLCMNQSIRLF